jgi:hypothetical protein
VGILKVELLYKFNFRIYSLFCSLFLLVKYNFIFLKHISSLCIYRYNKWSKFLYLTAEFRNEYPPEPVLLEEYGSVRACDLVYNDYLDLALINMGMSNIDKFNQSVLFTSQLYYCVAPTHPYASMPSLHMELVHLVQTMTLQILLKRNTPMTCPKASL